jgi:hypothetical protein
MIAHNLLFTKYRPKIHPTNNIAREYKTMGHVKIKLSSMNYTAKLGYLGIKNFDMRLKFVKKQYFLGKNMGRKNIYTNFAAP